MLSVSKLYGFEENNLKGSGALPIKFGNSPGLLAPTPTDACADSTVGTWVAKI